MAAVSVVMAAEGSEAEGWAAAKGEEAKEAAARAGEGSEAEGWSLSGLFKPASSRRSRLSRPSSSPKAYQAVQAAKTYQSLQCISNLGHLVRTPLQNFAITHIKQFYET